MYGLDNPVTQEYASRCLTARRLVDAECGSCSFF